MNKKRIKGFTLIELLAVIVILSLLTLIVGTSVPKLLKSSKSSLSEVQKKNIIAAAELWSADNLNSVSNDTILYEEDLKPYLQEDVIDPKTGEKFDVSVKISVSDDKVTYEVVENEE